jgi:hypothetical protein
MIPRDIKPQSRENSCTGSDAPATGIASPFLQYLQSCNRAVAFTLAKLQLAKIGTMHSGYNDLPKWTANARPASRNDLIS